MQRRAQRSSMAASTIETQTYLKQRHAFCGSIKCPIRRLRYEFIAVDPRQLDPKNVARLLGIFKLEGCRRLEPQNHVPALISRTSLNALLEYVPGGLSSLNLHDETPVHVDPNHDLTCLHGRHRIEAAKKYLHPDDKWWIVDLYADGKMSPRSEPATLIMASDLGETEVNELREEYSNAKNFFDGDIFRHLRRAHLAGNTSAKARWLSKLSKTKIRDIGLLEKRAAKDPQTQHLQSALDELLPFTGLWPALQIGTFHRLLSLRCPEVSFPIRWSRRLLITCPGNDEVSDTDQTYMGIYPWGRGGTPALPGRRYRYDTRGTMPKSLGRGRAPAPEKPTIPLLYYLCTTGTVYTGPRPQDRLYYTIYPYFPRRHQNPRALRQNHEEVAPHRLQNLDTAGVRSIA